MLARWRAWSRMSRRRRWPSKQPGSKARVARGCERRPDRPAHRSMLVKEVSNGLAIPFGPPDIGAGHVRQQTLGLGPHSCLVHRMLTLRERCFIDFLALGDRAQPLLQEFESRFVFASWTWVHSEVSPTSVR